MKTAVNTALAVLVSVIVSIAVILAATEFRPDRFSRKATQEVAKLREDVRVEINRIDGEVVAVKTTADKAAQDVTALDAKADRIAFRIAALDRQLFDERDGQIMNLWRSAWNKNRATAFGAKLEAVRANKRATRLEENVYYLAEDAADGDGISAGTGQAIVEQGKPETVAQAEQEVADLAAKP